MAPRHSRVYPECLNLAGLDVLIFFFFGMGEGCGLKNLFPKPPLKRRRVTAPVTPARRRC